MTPVEVDSDLLVRTDERRLGIDRRCPRIRGARGVYAAWHARCSLRSTMTTSCIWPPPRLRKALASAAILMLPACTTPTGLNSLNHRADGVTSGVEKKTRSPAKKVEPAVEAAPEGETAPPMTPEDRRAPPSSGTPSAPQSANCAYKCVDYAFKPFTCHSNWYCIGAGKDAGCLAQTSCKDTNVDVDNTSETSDGSDVCEYRCADYGYPPRECSDGYYCRTDGCLVEDNTCATAGGEGSRGGADASCEYACADYGYTAGICSGGYYCRNDGCLV
jgi:hypothetical protein